MRMRPGSVKNGLSLALAAATPSPIVIPIAVVTTSAFPPVGVAITATAPENVCHAKTGPARSASVPTPVTRVMAVNEFRTLFVPMRASATTSLRVRVS